MPYICSIILVLNSFDVRIGKEDILFKKGSAVLIDYNLKDFFSSNIDHVMIVDVEEKTVNDFFKSNTLSPFSVRRFYPAYLMVECEDFSLLKNLIACLNCDGRTVDFVREGANKRGNSSRLTQSFHFFMFEPIFSPVNALNQPI